MSTIISESIAEHLTKKEQEEFIKLTRKLPQHIEALPLVKAINGLSGTKFSDTACDDCDAAIILLKALSRYSAESYEEALFTYCYGKAGKIDKENILQKKILAKEIRNIRKETGLSQIKFCQKYDIKRRTLENWEMGKKKLSVYTLRYLYNCMTEENSLIDKITRLTLPMDMFAAETQKIIKELPHTADSSLPTVLHVEGHNFMPESYIIKVTEYEIFDYEFNIETEAARCPQDLRKILEYAIKNKCNEIQLTYEWYGEMPHLDELL